jgi:hypothetical protein
MYSGWFSPRLFEEVYEGLVGVFMLGHLNCFKSMLLEFGKVPLLLFSIQGWESDSAACFFPIGTLCIKNNCVA